MQSLVQLSLQTYLHDPAHDPPHPTAHIPVHVAVQPPLQSVVVVANAETTGITDSATIGNTFAALRKKSLRECFFIAT
jgi:hypothetical protein